MAGRPTEAWLRVGVGVEAEVGVVVGIGEGVDGVAAGAVVVVEQLVVEVAAETVGFGAGVSVWAGVSFAGDAVLL